MQKSEFIEILHKPIEQLVEEAKLQLKSSYSQNKDNYQRFLLSSLDMLFSECVRRQENGRKNAIQYLCFHNLYTSIETGTFEYKIALYDKNLYLDREEISTYWFPIYYNAIIEKDLETVKRLMQKNFIRVSNYDIKQMQKYYIKKILEITPEDVWDIKNVIQNVPSYEKMRIEKEFSIYIGEFMERVTELW